MTRADIPPQWRAGFEVCGVSVVQLLMSTRGQMAVEGQMIYVMAKVCAYVFSWLIEQAHRAERKETWSLAMEVAITLLVGAELVFDVLAWMGHPAR